MATTAAASGGDRRRARRPGPGSARRVRAGYRLPDRCDFERAGYSSGAAARQQPQGDCLPGCTAQTASGPG